MSSRRKAGIQLAAGHTDRRRFCRSCRKSNYRAAEGWIPAFRRDDTGFEVGGQTARKSQAKYMQKHIGWLWIIGFFGLVAAADAQTPSPPTATTQFDGTYAFVSATTLTETYMTTWRTRMGRCGDIRRMGPLTIANGQARYSGFGRVTKEGFEGTVGPQGEVTMKLAAPASHSSLGVEIMTRGTIDGSGTVRARQMGRSCSYDLVWQKETR